MGWVTAPPRRERGDRARWGRRVVGDRRGPSVLLLAPAPVEPRRLARRPAPWARPARPQATRPTRPGALRPARACRTTPRATAREAAPRAGRPGTRAIRRTRAPRPTPAACGSRAAGILPATRRPTCAA